MQRSQQLFDDAKGLFPGGVNSPVRAFGKVGGVPPYFKRGQGPYLFDEDDHRYIDYVGSWGPMILGHAHPSVIAAVKSAAESGLSFGAPTEIESMLAHAIRDALPSMEMMRMVSSGTEATMSAIRLARGFTSRDKIVKFEGCYHGHVDSLMVSSGSGLATFGIASSPGIPHDTVATTLICPLDDLEAVEYLFNEHGNEIAAVVIEPLPANNGLLIQNREFLVGLREICTREGIVLLFDEVISGFRVGFEGAAGYYDIQPDVMAFGKIIGGGLPVGAYASTAEIMNHFPLLLLSGLW